MCQAKQGTRSHPSQAWSVPPDVDTDAHHLSVARGIRTARILKQEQQCTVLLLDVMYHFKEKLQSLTSQMLLTRLGRAVTQALTQGVNKLLNENMR